MHFRHGGIPFQTYVFVFDAPSEPFHEDIVQYTPMSIHADAYAVRLEHSGEGLRGELAALIRVDVTFNVSSQISGVVSGEL